MEKVVGISEPASPAEKPRFELQTLDLDLPDFGVGFSLATPSEADAGCTISQIQSVMEDRVTSYSIAARPTVSGSSMLECESRNAKPCPYFLPVCSRALSCCSVHNSVRSARRRV